MKDESAHLQSTETASTGEDPPVAFMPLYYPGTAVTYQGQSYTVSHVIIRDGDLLVHFRETGTSVNADKVQLTPTRILLQRS